MRRTRGLPSRPAKATLVAAGPIVTDEDFSRVECVEACENFDVRTRDQKAAMVWPRASDRDAGIALKCEVFGFARSNHGLKSVVARASIRGGGAA
jgi:hypothetical protein